MNGLNSLVRLHRGRRGEFGSFVMNSNFEYTASIVRDHVEQFELPEDLREKIEAFITAESTVALFRAGDELTRSLVEDERIRTLIALVVHTMCNSYRLNR